MKKNKTITIEVLLSKLKEKYIYDIVFFKLSTWHCVLICDE